MDDGIQQGTWLLIDAAGPVSVIGLVDRDSWLACKQSQGDFLEWLQPGIEDLLQQSQSKLQNLSGILYGSGPGSTLGLRLAALFIRVLMELPELEHWRCFQYQCLELAICSDWKDMGQSLTAAVAPWRRDRLHLTEWDRESMHFKNSGILPDDAVTRKLPGYSLGRRLPGKSIDLQWKDYPVGNIPVILNHYPLLLQQTHKPTPYSAEVPQFAQWNPSRHPAK